MKRTHKLLSVLLCMMVLSALMTVSAFARTIIPVKPEGGMNLQVDQYGKLRWDSVSGATGYRIDICEYPGDFVLMTDSVGAGETSYDLFGELDDLEYDNGTYRVKVNVSGSNLEYTYSTLLFYYDSPYEKLPAPTNLRWNGNVAEWDAVLNADRYNVYIYNTTKTGDLSVRSNLTETSVDLSDLSPEDGWFFEVVAYGTGYRNSAISESPRKGGGSRTILPVSGSGAMNLKLLSNGTLLWDKYNDATSYTVEVFEHPGTFVLKTISVDKANQYCDLIAAMDQEYYDNGDYRIEVRANGSSADHPYDSMIIYYDSPYEKLTAPANLRWNGLFAEWNAVPGAQYYNVYVNDTTTGALMVKSNVKETYVALTDFEPQPGWYFEVIAYGSGYRYSAAGTSPRKGFIIGADTYDASEDELYSGGQVKVETEAGESEYSYEGESVEVRAGTEVSMNALPDDGYEFVEWRIGSETGECYSKSKSIGFRAEESLHLFAVFHKSIPEGVGTIGNPVVCSTFEEMKYALEHPTVQGILVNSFTNDPYQTFYTLKKEKDFKAGHCAITVPADTTKYLTINADIDIRVPYVDYLLYSFIDVRGTLTVGGSGTLGVSMNARGYPSAILFNNGNLEVGGTITLDPSNKSFDSMHGYSIVSATGKTVIYNGTFIGYTSSAVHYQGGSMEIHGGTFTVENGNEQAFGLNADTYLSVAEHDVALYGGTFDGIRADQSIGVDVPKLPDLLGYGAYYAQSSGDIFDSAGLLDTHNKLTVKMYNIINEVELVIQQPSVGNKPKWLVDSYDSSKGYAPRVQGVEWEVSTSGSIWNEMLDNETFTIGKRYRVSVALNASKEYMFALDASQDPVVSATINGKTAYVYSDGDPGKTIYVRYDFGILNDNTINQIDIDGIIEPVVGEYPIYDCTVGGNGYTINLMYSGDPDKGATTINGVCWVDVTDGFGSPIKSNEPFRIGHTYKVFVDVKTEDGYVFDTNCWGYINGNYAGINKGDGPVTELNLYWTFTCQPKTIKSVAVTGLDIPADGANPDFTATTDLPDYYTVESIEWSDYTSGVDMNESHTFVAGHEYWLTLTVVPKVEEGEEVCKFVSGKTTATLNGVEVKNTNGWTDVIVATKRVTIRYSFTVTEENPPIFWWNGDQCSVNPNNSGATMAASYTGGKLTEVVYFKNNASVTLTGDTVKVFFLQGNSFAPLRGCASSTKPNP